MTERVPSLPRAATLDGDDATGARNAEHGHCGPRRRDAEPGRPRPAALDRSDRTESRPAPAVTLDREDLTEGPACTRYSGAHQLDRGRPAARGHSGPRRLDTGPGRPHAVTEDRGVGMGARLTSRGHSILYTSTT